MKQCFQVASFAKTGGASPARLTTSVAVVRSATDPVMTVPSMTGDAASRECKYAPRADTHNWFAPGFSNSTDPPVTT